MKLSEESYMTISNAIALQYEISNDKDKAKLQEAQNELDQIGVY